MVCWQAKLCDPHLSALEVRFSRRGAIQIYVYLYPYLYYGIFTCTFLRGGDIIKGYVLSCRYVRCRASESSQADRRRTLPSCRGDCPTSDHDVVSSPSALSFPRCSERRCGILRSLRAPAALCRALSPVRRRSQTANNTHTAY